MKANVVCTNCGYHGPAVYGDKGGCFVELVLWFFFIVPGLIYSVWRRSNLPIVCPRCGSSRWVSDDTPEGQRLISRVEGEGAAKPTTDVPLALQRLAALYERGLLSAEDFEAQKRKLLDADGPG